MNIILYTKRGCSWCRDILDLFAQKGVTFEEREVYSNKAFFDELVVKSGQAKTPTLDIDGDIIADTDKGQVTAILKQKNHPAFL